MNFKLLLITSILLTGCGVADIYKITGHRQWKVGDCLVLSLSEPEEWRIADYVVVDIGKNSYRVQALPPYSYYTEISYGHLWEGFYKKVSCREENSMPRRGR